MNPIVIMDVDLHYPLLIADAEALIARLQEKVAVAKRAESPFAAACYCYEAF